MSDNGHGAAVAVAYSSALAHAFSGTRAVPEAVSLTPEVLWHVERSGPGDDAARYVDLPAATEVFEAFSESIPLKVFHGIGLSVAGGLPLDMDHVERIALLADRLRPAWYSEHLAASRIGDGHDGEQHAGVGLSVPFDRNLLEDLIDRVPRILSVVAMPFLLENSAIYTEVPDCDFTEAGLLNRLAEATGCGVLLDLHNLMTNERNLGWSAEDYLAELELANVREIHVAGGEPIGRWWTDAHSGRSPQRVQDLLAAVVPACPNLRLVTFEIHQSRIDPLGIDGLLEEVTTIRKCLG